MVTGEHTSEKLYCEWDSGPGLAQTEGSHRKLPRKEAEPMKVMIDFFRTMLRLPRPWVGWVILLMTVNMIVPLFYLGTPEGKIVLGGAVLGAVLQTAIFSTKGFVRLLGIGHIAWVPMVAWLWSRLDLAPAGSLFRYWLLATLVLVSVSLLIDASDVIRYIRGERDPQL